VVIIGLIKAYLRVFPKIERDLKIAHVKQTPEYFAKKNLLVPLYGALVFTFLGVLFLLKFEKNILFAILIFIIVYAFGFFFIMQTPRVYILKRKRAVDREVLFAGQYLLVKMQSGVPFFNAIEDASKSYGVAGQFFKEIVDDVNLGTPLEEALEKAARNTPSEGFKKILWQIINALRTGTDTTKALRTILEQITTEQMRQIRAYGKKLNSLAMFYLILAVVIPSLGLTMLSAILSFLPGIRVNWSMLALILTMLAFIQFMFISLFRQIKPTVNI